MKHLASGLTLLILGGTLWWAVSQRQEDSAGDPQDAIWQMVDHAKAGDAAAYLDCFTGDIRTQLERLREEMTPPRFSRYLEENIAALKGVAVFDVERDGERASLIVEYLYKDSSEKQQLELAADRGTWRIAAAQTSRRKESLIPYGTSVELVP